MRATSQQTFVWHGRDRSGKAVDGRDQATNADELALRLRHQGVYQARIAAQRQADPGRTGGIRAKDLMLLTRQLATMTQAGISIVHAFDMAARSARTPKVKALVLALRQQVEQGTPLHQAFADYPRYFDALYCASVASGEASGSLDEVLEGLAKHLEKAQALRAKVRSALMYPTVVSLVAVAAVSVIMIWMVPAFEAQFASFGAPLPEPTQWIIAISRWLTRNGWYLIALALLGAWGLWRIWRSGGRGRALMDELVLRPPVLGTLLRKAAVARWSRTLATLIHSGVPLMEALKVIGHAAGNAVFVRASAQIARDIEHGVSLSQAMQSSGAFPDTVVHMCLLGEESGTLDTMLAKSAAMLEGDVDEAVSGLSSIVEPLMIIVLGVIIGAILLAMYLPIFQLGRVI